jgi:metallophosphoesterase (TIGR00282 family)
VVEEGEVASARASGPGATSTAGEEGEGARGGVASERSASPAGGFGLTRAIAEEFFGIGIDVISTGNHWADQKEILTYIEGEDRILRPANYPKGTPGRGSNLYQTPAGSILVVNVMGRVFMDALDDPFAAVERELSACPLGEGADAIVVDVHAEATSEKMAMGHWCDGQASLVVGTHTHVPTGDAMILPKGTAYQTDAGMCGDYDSVIGMEKLEPLRRFITGMASGRFEPASGPATLSGVYVETDDKTGLNASDQGQSPRHIPHQGYAALDGLPQRPAAVSGAVSR